MVVDDPDSRREPEGARERPERCGYTSTNMQRESETDYKREREDPRPQKMQMKEKKASDKRIIKTQT